MFVLRFTVRLPLEENLFKTETREVKFSKPTELLRTYKRLKRHENIFGNIKAYVVFEEEIDLEKFTPNILKGEKKGGL